MLRKYPSWGEFLKKHRSRKYRSAREFCLREAVGISYPQYSRYEAGDQLPSLEQALDLCKMLEVPILEGLLEWSRTQIREANVRKDVEQLLDQVREQGKGREKPESTANHSASSVVPLDDVIVFNRSHLRLFEADPAFRDIFTYVNSCSPEWVSAEEVAQALSLPVARAKAHLEALWQQGIILLSEGRCRAAKRNFYFPDDRDFFPLRNQNFDHNVKELLGKLTFDDLTSGKSLRGLVTRELTEEQITQVIGQLEETLKQMVSLPDNLGAEKIYSACLLFGERFRRAPIENEIQPSLVTQSPLSSPSVHEGDLRCES